MANSELNDFFPVWQKILRLGWIAAAICLVAVGTLLYSRSRPQKYNDGIQLPLARQWSSDSGLTISPVFSRSQKFVAYASDRNGSGNLAIWIQPYPSGAPRRITNDAFNDSDPDLSPDETQVAFRSERDGGGIYVAPVSGGSAARFLAKGLRPRFSPDGKWIAYYDLVKDGDIDNSSPRMGRIFIVPAQGGTPLRIRGDFAYALYPVWAPDAKHLLFEGADVQGWHDWWVTPLDDNPAVATRAWRIVSELFRTVHAPERWSDGNVLFSATLQERPHLWLMRVSEKNWQVSTAPRQLTESDDNDQVGSIGADGKLIFTRMRISQDLWSLPVDSSRGVATGALRQITDDHGVDSVPSITADGAKLLYVSDKTGIRDIWLRTMATGVEQSATAFNPVGARPALSYKGTRVVYPTTVQGHCAVLIKELGDQPKTSALQGCFNIWDWSADGASMLVYNGGDSVQSVDLLKPQSEERETLLSHPAVRFFDASFSRDDRWITFTAGVSPLNVQVYVAPLRKGRIPESEWIAVTHEGGGFAAWSPDGGMLYFHSSRDGFPCIWAQKLDANKRPSGAAAPVQHFHNIAMGTYLMRPTDFHITVSKDRLVVNLVKQTANLWVTSRKE